MKKLLLITLFIVVCKFGITQENSYVGIEYGALMDKYHYINEKGSMLSQTGLGGASGFIFGYNFRIANLESGIYYYNSGDPFLEYNYEEAKPQKSNSSSNGVYNWVIPLRFGKSFAFFNDKFFLHPQISINSMISEDYIKDSPVHSWGDNIANFFPDSLVTDISSDSTIAYGYVPSKFNLGLETTISAGFKIWEKCDLYFKGGYIGYVRPTLNESITHYSDTEIVKGSRTSLSSYILQIGLKYNFINVKG